jgi:hypothetical protein
VQRLSKKKQLSVNSVVKIFPNPNPILKVSFIAHHAKQKILIVTQRTEYFVPAVEIILNEATED